VRTCFTYNFKGARSAPGRDCPLILETPGDRTADAGWQHVPAAGVTGDCGAPGRRLPAFGPFGPRRRRRELGPRRPPRGSSSLRQRWRAELQERPSLRRPILKPCKIAGKGAPAARRLLAQAQTLARGSWQGFIRRQSEGWPGSSVAGVCSWLL
jgi:hypothetical protein